MGLRLNVIGQEDAPVVKTQAKNKCVMRLQE